MDNIPDEFKCPITLEIMDDPVLCEDGYSYEKSAIIAIQNSLSPITRQPINKSKLIPNRALKNTISKYKVDIKRKLEKHDQKMKEKHNQKLKVFLRLRENWIERDKQRNEEIKLELIKLRNIRDEKVKKIENELKEMILISKYNDLNSRFEYGIKYEYCSSNGRLYLTNKNHIRILPGLI